ncbi:FapA family protein [Alkalihalobacillus sp. BA299]|uniref:FapA family protein n=1 Tax=Alkalihalobacillus sp. BA299 TaxID=2815938 RepID=UPI001AD9FC16|nr:FapA family protein [Alkalihalobacillus sp. BA299]
MQSIVSKGKNITEAINLGLDLLEATKKEVNIEILQYEKKGFLGIRSKEAIVKLTKIEKASSTDASSGSEKPSGPRDPFAVLEEMVEQIPSPNLEKIEPSLIDEGQNKDRDEHDISQDRLGEVWVENGKLYCRSSPDHFPMVTLTKGIKLYKNHQLVTEKTTIITENDHYEMKVEHEEKGTKWHTSIDDHKLKVQLSVEPGYKILRSIPDIEPAQHIQIEVEEKKEVHNSLTYGTIVEKLRALRVIHGFNHNEMVKASEATEPGTYEIATGKEPKPGRDGWVEPKMDLEEKVGPVEDEDGSVDYHEIRSIPTVESGQVIAIIHPPIPGECGYTVTNETIPAKQTFPVALKVGRGISILDDKIIALEAGRPKIEMRGYFVKAAIMPKHMHYGDVNLTSGNIHFSGDVEIVGNIDESMIVEAKEGDIIVHKEINRATVIASGAIITYGNIVGSEVSAGKSNLLVTELGHLLGILHQNVEKMLMLIQQLTCSPAFKDTDFSRGGLKPLLSILLEKKFQNFASMAKQYVSVVRNGEDHLPDDEWREVAVALSQLFLSLTNEVITQERMLQLSQKMKELHELSQIPVEPNSYLSIPSVSNSRLYCSGNVRITGKGCVNTKIHAGGFLKINGIIRGGEVYGRLGVDIMEAGSEIGTPTLVAAPSDQQIKIVKAMEGTTIKIGNVRYNFKETAYRVLARLDQDERIVFD